jgi:hypothetical protein
MSPSQSRRALGAVSLALTLVLGSIASPALAGRDRDGDGMPDRWEKANGFDPRRSDGKKDADGDGLKNVAEFRKGTDPRDKDSDDDDLKDGVESKLGADPSRYDTDGDGNSDGTEVNLDGTDPKDAGSNVTRCPLTGEVADGDLDAVAVKIDNAPAAGMPTGLGSADVVVESLVEGGLTRFTAIFGCEDPVMVGPVRSARADDAAFLAPFTDTLVFSGANAIVQEGLDATGMTSVTEATTPGLFTRTEALAPYDLFADVSEVAGAIPAPLRFGTKTGKTAVSSVDLDLGGVGAVRWTWDGTAWMRSQDGVPSLTTDSGPMAADNVVVQLVDTSYSDELGDALGNMSPEMDMAAGGKVLVFRDGKVRSGTWQLKGSGFVYKDAAGNRLSLARGNTWIEMVGSPEGELVGSVSY